MKARRLILILVTTLLLIGIASAAWPPPEADFIGYNQSVCIYEVIQFYDLSNYYGATPTAWFWQFGDSQDSHIQDPTHYYDTPGVYDVSLWVQDDYGTDTEIKIGYITVRDCYTPDFTANETCVIGTDAFIFLNTTCHTDSVKNCRWNISSQDSWTVWNGSMWLHDADGLFGGYYSPTYSDYNAFINFSEYGIYTVNHECIYPGVVTSWVNKTDYITIGVPGTFCECNDTCNNCGAGKSTGGEAIMIVFGMLGVLIAAPILIRRGMKKGGNLP